MARLSAVSNPTNLKQLDKRSATITVSDVSGVRAVTLDRLDVSNTNLSGDLRVFLVARAGNTSVRHDMGLLSAPVKTAKSIDQLDRSQPLRFRILIHESNNPKLVASIENLRSRDESQGESLLPMEPAELGQQLWRLVLDEDGPVLQFNANVFPSAAGAENYLPFSAFVLPEAIKQVMLNICSKPGCLEDEADPWFGWAAWIDALGVGRPPMDEEDLEKQKWCCDVAYRFAEKFLFAKRMQDDFLKVVGND